MTIDHEKLEEVFRQLKRDFTIPGVIRGAEGHKWTRTSDGNLIGQDPDGKKPDITIVGAYPPEESDSDSK